MGPGMIRDTTITRQHLVSQLIPNTNHAVEVAALASKTVLQVPLLLLKLQRILTVPNSTHQLPLHLDNSKSLVSLLILRPGMIRDTITRQHLVSQLIPNTNHAVEVAALASKTVPKLQRILPVPNTTHQSLLPLLNSSLFDITK